MIQMIAKREFLENLMSYKFTVAIVLCLAVVLVSNLVLLSDYQKRMEDYSASFPEKGELRALKRPSVLSIFAKGLDDNMGRSFDIRNYWREIAPSAKQRRVNPLFSLFPTPDYSYVVRVIMSLLAILFAFDAVCGEKTKGTLRLALSNSIPRSHILLGKWIGGFASLVLPFLIATLFGLVVISVVGKSAFSQTQWGRIGLIVLSSVIYISIFFSLGLLVSARVALPRTSIVSLLFLWAILVFAIPNLGILLARKAVALPSVQQLEQRKTELWVEIVNAKERGVLNKFLAIPAHSTKKWPDLIKGQQEKFEETYRNQLNRFITLSQNICRTSPASSYLFTTSGLAWASYQDEKRFKQAVTRYRDSLVLDEKFEVKEETPFRYENSSLVETLGSGVLLDLGLMLIFGLLFFLGSYLSFLKYDVR